MWKRKEKEPIGLFLTWNVIIWIFAFVALKLLQSYSVEYSNNGEVTAGYLAYASPFVYGHLLLRLYSRQQRVFLRAQYIMRLLTRLVFHMIGISCSMHFQGILQPMFIG